MNSRLAAKIQAPQLSGRFTPSFMPMVVLQACHIAELTGILRARRGAEYVTVGFASGEIAGAEALDCEGLDALLAFSRWTEGHFDFTAGPRDGDAILGSFNYLLLEVCRRMDEERARAATPSAAAPASP